MSKDPTSPPNPMLFPADSLVSRSPVLESSEVRTTPAISGRKCLDLSGNAGPLGLLEKMLLGSSDWAWTKYSLTWQPKATPQGRLIFQLARLAPRTFDNGSGLLHTPTAQANQMAPSMRERDQGSWGLGLWPTPNAREKGGGEYQDPEKIKARIDKGHQTNLGDAVKMWPTPRAQEAKHGAATEWELQTGHAGTKDSLRVQVVKRMWPTPTQRDGKGGYQGGRIRNGEISRDTLDVTIQHTDNQEKSGGKLNPQWVAWLMGYPTEYLNSVPWGTPSSRRSPKRSGKR
jgi:hypothetical protein